jgi:hypothetical protein
MGDVESSPDKRQHGRSRFLTFWTTLPGVLTGLAALLTAVISVVTVLHSGGGSPTTPAAATSMAAVSSPSFATTRNSSPPGTSDTNIASSGGTLAQGRISMQSGDFADLEHNRVGNGVPDPDLGFVVAGNDYQLTAMKHLARIAGQPANRTACVAALNSRSDTYVLMSQLQVGSQLCVQTSGNHVAALRAVSLPGPGNPDFVYLYTVWQ